MSFTTPSTRWAAVTTRNPLASNSFIYSVLSTRIYCRPNCPSRLARRANIIFHDTAAEAEKAGFRACKRCKPDVDFRGGGGEIAEKARRLLDEEGMGGEGKRWSVKELARECGVTESHFCRVFRRAVGCTVREYRVMMVSAALSMEQVGVESVPGSVAAEGLPGLFGEWNLGLEYCTNEKNNCFGGVESYQTNDEVYPGFKNIGLACWDEDGVMDVSQLVEEDYIQFLNFDAC